MNIGGPELLIVLLVVLLLFGSTQLPKLARAVGEATRELKQGMAEDSSTLENPDDSAVRAPTSAPDGRRR